MNILSSEKIYSANKSPWQGQKNVNIVVIVMVYYVMKLLDCWHTEYTADGCY